MFPLRQARVEIAQDGVQFALAVGEFFHAQVPDAYLVEQVIVLLLQVAYHLRLCLVLLAVLAELLPDFIEFAVGVAYAAFQLYHLLPCAVLLHDDFELYPVYF